MTINDTRRRGFKSLICGGATAVLLIAGCTRESVRVALASQRRADQVQQTVFDRQHDALRVLMYRDLVRRLDADGEPLTDAQRASLNDAWNERDLIEFWALQHERAKALRLMGVDAKLYSDQSMIDLWAKAIAAKADQAAAAIAAQAGAQLQPPEPETSPDAEEAS